MKEPECENTPTCETEDDEEDESSRREGGGLVQTRLSHVQSSEFSMEPQSSPGEGEGNADRPTAGG